MRHRWPSASERTPGPVPPAGGAVLSSARLSLLPPNLETPALARGCQRQVPISSLCPCGQLPRLAESWPIPQDSHLRQPRKEVVVSLLILQLLRFLRLFKQVRRSTNCTIPQNAILPNTDHRSCVSLMRADFTTPRPRSSSGGERAQDATWRRQPHSKLFHSPHSLKGYSCVTNQGAL